jgi:hypothetical protein
MTENSMLPSPGGPASPRTADTRPGPQLGPALLAAVLVVAGSAIVGFAAGLIWAAVAPRVQYQVATLHPPTAYATNPETSAFIAADGSYCVIALIGGALIGVLAYIFAIRRYGPVAMTGTVAGSVAAAFITSWVGHQASGATGFNAVLANSKQFAYLYAPISLGSGGALAFWPFAAAAVAGGIGLVAMLRARNQTPYGFVPMPGIDSFGLRSYSAGRPDTSPAPSQAPGSALPGYPAAGLPAAGFPPASFPPASFPAEAWGAPAQPGADGNGLRGGPDARPGDQGQASR